MERLQILFHTVVQAIGRAILFLFVFAVLGQIPISGVSIENHYHGIVNSSAFQKGFRIALRPIVWSGEKLYAALTKTKAYQKSVDFVEEASQTTAGRVPAAVKEVVDEVDAEVESESGEQ